MTTLASQDANFTRKAVDALKYYSIYPDHTAHTNNDIFPEQLSYTCKDEREGPDC